MATRPADLYEEDFYAWTRAQAAALRRLAAERCNGPLDLARLAEEVEDLGSERRDAVRSQLRRIIEHRLELALSPAAEPRRGWLDTIDDALAEIEDRMTPSIRRDVEERLPRLFDQTRLKVVRALERYAEPEAAARVPRSCPWTLDELLTAPAEGRDG